MTIDKLVVRGAREHNLKNVSIELPRNALIVFTGLSGSGKTYTVFGPDATDAPEAWFKHSEPHNGWGIFPRLAYDIFQEKKDNWKITMKYFQNVVDTVRDLMSPNAEEQHYKNGMHKDADGFTDIDWCCSKVITSWNHLREEFQKANTRKAISPTQFNPIQFNPIPSNSIQSTPNQCSPRQPGSIRFTSILTNMKYHIKSNPI